MTTALPLRTYVTVAFTATDETLEVVAAAGAGKKIHVVAYEWNAVGADAALVWKSATTAISGSFDSQYADGIAASPYRNSHRDACIVTNANEALNVTVTGTATGYVTYYVN